ncbi:MAG TPA: hypothetical protein VIA18_05065 [Polyangia bacterium]|nr:hypothetical protein [Polyangia bacterium]
MTATTKTPSISARLVRSSLRYLREREGAAALAQIARELPRHAFLTQPKIDDGWIALPAWLEVLAAFERRFGDPPTYRLLREMTRATMAAAISSVWATFLQAASPEQLLDRSADFFTLSFDTGKLVVVDRAPHRAKLAVENWPNPPRELGVIVAEACAVFLARIGHAQPRVVDSVVNQRLEIAGAW